MLVHALESFPNQEKERIKTIKKNSKSVCGNLTEQIPDLSSIKDDAIITNSVRGVLKNTIENINTAYGMEMPTKYFDEISRLTKYVPLLSSVLNYMEVCCTINSIVESGKEIRENLRENYYIALLLIVVELVLLPSNLGYRSAFMGTRYVANYGLVRIRHILGLRVYSLFLSIVHWAFRGTIEGVLSYIVSKTAQTIKEHDKFVDEVDKSDLDFDFLEEDKKDTFDFIDTGEKKFNGLIEETEDIEEFFNQSDSEDDGWDIPYFSWTS